MDPEASMTTKSGNESDMSEKISNIKASTTISPLLPGSFTPVRTPSNSSKECKAL